MARTVTPVFGWDTPILGEEANVPADLASLALDVENTVKALEPKRIATAGAGDSAKLLIVDGTGAPAFKAMSGDATITNLGALAIGAEKVVNAMLGALSVTATKIGAEQVETTKVKALAVTAAKLAEEAVETIKLQNLAVTEAKLANLAVALGKLSTEVQEMLQAAGGYTKMTWLEAESTRTNVAFGAFSTPLAATVAKVKAHQGVALNMFAYVLGTGAPTLRMMAGGTVISNELVLANEAKYFQIGFEASGALVSFGSILEAEIGAVLGVLNGQYTPISKTSNHAPNVIKAPSTPGTNVVFELQAKIAAGTVKNRGFWLVAQPMG
jgi:hypothetical protein